MTSNNQSSLEVWTVPHKPYLLSRGLYETTMLLHHLQTTIFPYGINSHFLALHTKEGNERVKKAENLEAKPRNPKKNLWKLKPRFLIIVIQIFVYNAIHLCHTISETINSAIILVQVNAIMPREKKMDGLYQEFQETKSAKRWKAKIPKKNE